MLALPHMTLSLAPIFFRWLHVGSACILIGSVFFHDLLLPMGTRGLDAASQELVALRCRRGFKMTVHVTLLLFLISGIFNAIKNWPIYTSNPGLMHGMFGMHVLLGLGAITLLMIALAGREPKRARAGWTRLALVALLLGVAAASTLKSAREWTITHQQTAPPKVVLH
jgi:uncharacterized membrane protein